jgi:hypothetical protein
MSKDLIVSEGAIGTTDGVPTGTLVLRGSLDLQGTGNVVTTPHDALYAYHNDMVSSGTDVPESAQDVGFPRWSLADAATQRVKWAWAIPVGWNSIAVRWGWDNESAGAGNVVWQLSHRQVVLGEVDVDAGAMTDIAVGPLTAGGQFDLAYATPASTSAIAIVNGGFGDKPTVLFSLSRLGADGADTLAGAAAVMFTTATRVS